MGGLFWRRGSRRRKRRRRRRRRRRKEGRCVRAEEVVGLPRGEAGAMEGKQLLGEREVLR